MKVLLETGVWLTEGEGDPPRTLKKENAHDFKTLSDALIALAEARRYRPFVDAQIDEGCGMKGNKTIGNTKISDSDLKTNNNNQSKRHSQVRIQIERLVMFFYFPPLVKYRVILYKDTLIDDWIAELQRKKRIWNNWKHIRYAPINGGSKATKWADEYGAKIKHIK